MTQKIKTASSVSVVAICVEPDAKCEQCGKKDELRPYGKKLESGRRMSICFDCAMLDKPTTNAAFSELLDD